MTGAPSRVPKTRRNPGRIAWVSAANSGPRWSTTGRSIARKIRSGTFVGPGICRNGRPLTPTACLASTLPLRLLCPMVRLAPTRPPVPSATEPDHGGAYKWTVLSVVGAGIYMATLDAGIVNVALPVLTREFATSLTVAQWVVLGYVLCITGLLLPAGRLADVAGRKEVFLGGFVLFGLASALCGLAPTIEWLGAPPGLQGVGGALGQGNTGALVTQAFPASERGRALGIQGSIVSVGLLSGPVIGGVITEYLG